MVASAAQPAVAEATAFAATSAAEHLAAASAAEHLEETVEQFLFELNRPMVRLQ